MVTHELSLLRRLLPHLKQDDSVLVPPGDDCAAVEGSDGKLLLLAADQLISSVHYLPETPPKLAGAKLMKRNLSDIAAMGGIPRWALLTLAERGRDENWAFEFIAGASEAGNEYHTFLVGGDFASLPEAECSKGAVASLSIIGEVERDLVIRRSGARAGDCLLVTGKLGGSFPGERHLTFTPRLEEGRFLAEGKFASAMLDISDGLLLDASRLATASNVGIRLNPESLPCHAGASLENAMSDGEDYELLFTVPEAKRERLLRAWPKTFAPLTVIGTVFAGSGVQDEKHCDLLKNRRIGYEH